MAVEDDLLAEIQSVLGYSTPISSVTSASAASDLFEVYVLSIVLEAAISEGATVSYETVAGNSPANFIFRKSPGYVSTNTQDYVHALNEFDGKPILEAHVGIYIQGKAKVRHEADVAVLLRSEAESCRGTEKALPRYDKIILVAECKFYSGNVPLGQARSFLGLNKDIGYTKGRRFFVVNTPSPSSIQLVEEHHSRKWGNNIHPASINSTDKLKSSFQRVFESFITSARW
jgi:hypothetical protein